MTLPAMHILAGMLAVVFGYVALKVIYIPALLPIPVLAPIVVMMYWLWRDRIRETTLGIVGVSARQVSGATK